MNKPELLAPAGNYENAYFALKYGADAIYQGLEGLSLRRTKKAESSIDELKRAVELAHSMGKKHYLAMNLFAHQEDIEQLKSRIEEIREIGTDAFIVSDLGIFFVLKEAFPDAEYHLSTQANTLNIEAINFWKTQGVSRVILARELTREETKDLLEKTDIELEMFVHGAMCMSYSGRCHLSNYFLGRDANRGECAQPCRWSYDLKRDDLRADIEIEETDAGVHIMNSKDMCLINYVKEIVDMGISSLKIEGRNKTSYYVANVVRSYRAMIDASDSDIVRERCLEELELVSHRDYSTGFYDGEKGRFNFDSSGYIKKAKMVGVASSDGQKLTIEVRDKIETGDNITIISPDINADIEVKIAEMIDTKTGIPTEVAHNGYQISMMLKTDQIDSLLVRKVINNNET